MEYSNQRPITLDLPGDSHYCYPIGEFPLIENGQPVGFDSIPYSNGNVAVTTTKGYLQNHYRTARAVERMIWRGVMHPHV